VQQPGSHLSLAPEPEAPEEPERLEADAARPVATPERESPSPEPLDPVEIPPERRPSWSNLAVLAAACGLGAVVLGMGALLWPGDDPSGSSPAAAPPGLERAVSLLADPAVERITFAGSVGRIVLLVGQRGDGVLVLNGLGAAPEGRAYQAWVTEPGPGETHAAGLFDGTERFVPLTEPVAPGAQVSVMLAPERGADVPASAPQLYAVRPPKS